MIHHHCDTYMGIVNSLSTISHTESLDVAKFHHLLAGTPCSLSAYLRANDSLKSLINRV